MKKLRTQEEIISNWKGDIDKPLVSICCITYNHELYIEDALEGFLIQETDFPFEILIHDDASTDKTADIIREYEAKYPKLIKPVYQIENQFSKGKKPGFLCYEKAKGDYIAVCEGDDYWTEKIKLNIQIDFMENNPLCVMSYHPAIQRYQDFTQKSFIINQRISNSVFLSDSEVIFGQGAFFPTASVVFCRKDVLKYFGQLKNIDIQGDFVLAISALSSGKIGYIDKVMSVYRRHKDGITQSYKYSMDVKSALIYRKNIYYKTIYAIDKFDTFLLKKYNFLFEESKKRYLLGWLKSNTSLLPFKEAFFLNTPFLKNLRTYDQINLILRSFLKIFVKKKAYERIRLLYKTFVQIKRY